MWVRPGERDDDDERGLAGFYLAFFFLPCGMYQNVRLAPFVVKCYFFFWVVYRIEYTSIYQFFPCIEIPFSQSYCATSPTRLRGYNRCLTGWGGVGLDWPSLLLLPDCFGGGLGRVLAPYPGCRLAGCAVFVFLKIFQIR